MNTPALRAPRAPTEQLCLESTKILAKLDLILEFRPWLNWTRYLLHRKFKEEPPFRVLFDCFALGASLGVLLDLLGSPAPSHLSVDLDKFDFHLDLAEREKYFASFIHRVNLLEVQGKLRYGEVLRVEDLFGGTSSGFMKVLKTVQRLLDALQASYPGLYELPEYAQAERQDNIFDLVDTERAHVSSLQMILDLSAELSCTSNSMQITLEPLVINNNRLRQYHDYVLEAMERMLFRQHGLGHTEDSEDWLEIFRFNDDFTRSNISATYRALCMCHLDIFEFMKEQVDLVEPALAGTIQTLLHILSAVPSRIAEYCTQLQAILDWTVPSLTSTYSSLPSTTPFDGLCTILYRMSEISSAIDEMSWQIRSHQGSRILKLRAFHWNKDVDPTRLGILLLDDHLKPEDSGQTYQVFLFETMLLCCLDEKRPRPDLDSRRAYTEPMTQKLASWYDWTRGKWSAWGKQVADHDGPMRAAVDERANHPGDDFDPHRRTNARQDSNEEYATRYPIPAWELGPALQRKTPINLVYAIPTDSIKMLSIHGERMFSLSWTDGGQDRVLGFSCTRAEQKDQWCMVLEGFAQQVLDVSEEQDGKSFTETINSSVVEFDVNFLNVAGRPFSRPRPWSLIGRKGQYSESSSLHQQKILESTDLLLSPDILPQLFSPKSRHEKGNKGTTSPMSFLALEENIRDSGVGMMSPIEMPPSWKSIFADAKSQELVDLTGQVSKTGRFPEAHGGFADVWKGIWKQKDGLQKTVAVKVLRSRIDDPEIDAKHKKGLSRELAVWKQLDHPNVLPLYGTVSDFGIYVSMVCPWLENGSVTKYLEKCGDILSMTDRLQFLVEVAEGLAYLHSYDIVHGDLTGANILIDDQRKACLCDFGLSNIIDFEASNVYSSVSGAIRWADASLYRMQIEDHVPKPTKRSDIYSFGSVTLEILSGRIPYHYVRNDVQVFMELHRGNKPRRPAPLFVTDTQWSFIQKCWQDEPDKRPDAMEVLAEVKELYKASLEHRRWTS